MLEASSACFVVFDDWIVLLEGVFGVSGKFVPRMLIYSKHKLEIGCFFVLGMLSYCKYTLIIWGQDHGFNYWKRRRVRDV